LASGSNTVASLSIETPDFVKSKVLMGQNKKAEVCTSAKLKNWVNIPIA
jgi:hypothetical protein